MREKRADMGGAFIVASAILGLGLIVGIIFWMMLAPSGIQHSPREAVPSSSLVIPGPHRSSLPELEADILPRYKVTLTRPAHI